MSITEQIEFTNSEYITIVKIAQVYDQTVTEYLNEIIHEQVKLELDNTDGLDAAFCNKLKDLFENEEQKENVS